MILGRSIIDFKYIACLRLFKEYYLFLKYIDDSIIDSNEDRRVVWDDV